MFLVDEGTPRPAICPDCGRAFQGEWVAVIEEVVPDRQPGDNA
jgi:hypothetical protein